MRYATGVLPLGCLALVFPRLTVALVWLFADGYLERAIDPGVRIVLGFVFLPLTTLTFAYGVNTLAPGGEMPPLGWVLVAIALLIDLGMIGRGGRASRSRRNAD